VSETSQIEEFENNLKILKFVELEAHNDWVRDVAWLNYVGYAYDTIASCSEDETVIIWIYDEKEQKWKNNNLSKKFNTPTWKVSWSYCGSYLAVSAGDNCVYLFKESVKGNWEEFTLINQDGNVNRSNSIDKTN